MNRGHSFRYDPLYRVIHEPAELQTVEGSFQCLFHRLKRINNLGIIPEVFEMAKYPKYEHGLGTIHQVESLLQATDTDVIPERYRLPLKLAAIFAHIGHLPYTYSTERALLLASNLGDRSQENDSRKHLNRVFNKVLKAAQLGADRQQSILDNMFALRDYKHLYRFFSAEVLVDKWDTLSRKIEDLDEGALKTTVRNLVDAECEGYKYLDLANTADFVQRDALYLGTVQLNIAPEHLYGQLSNQEPNLSVDERKLIQYNLDYLTEKFYDNPEVVCFSRLYEKILASLIVCKNFELQWLREYDDSELKRLICDNLDKDNRGARLAGSWITKGNALFDGDLEFEVFVQLSQIAFAQHMDAIDIEYELIGKRESVRGLLTYPFTKGVLLSIDYESKAAPFTPRAQQLVSVTIFRSEHSEALAELLKIIKRLSPRLSVLTHAEEVSSAVAHMLSWTDTVRFDNEPVVREIAEAIAALESGDKYQQGEFIRSYLRTLSSITTFESLWDNSENQFLWRTTLQLGLGEPTDDARMHFVRGLLKLPSRLLQFALTRRYLDEISAELLSRLTSDIPSSKKGDIFEALHLLNRVRNRRGRFQLFLNGMVVRNLEKSPGQRDHNEFDVIELFTNEDGQAECWIYACSIADDYEARNREQLTTLVDYLHNVFPELTIRSWYAIPKAKHSDQWEPIEEDTGRNYN